MKFSVYEVNTATRPPSYFLGLSKFAYDTAPIDDYQERLMYAACMSTIYLGALRVSEAVGDRGLTIGSFTHESSPSGESFLVSENTVNLKHNGGIKPTAIYEKDLIAVSLLAYLKSLRGMPSETPLFELSRFTPLNVVKRYTGGEGWAHWLRSQRVSWLSSYLSPFELDSVGGWGVKMPKNPRDRYVHRNWRDFADKIVKATDDYWMKNPPTDEYGVWLERLASSDGLSPPMREETKK